jgi:hypothetical protein
MAALPAGGLLAGVSLAGSLVAALAGLSAAGVVVATSFEAATDVAGECAAVAQAAKAMAVVRAAKATAASCMIRMGPDVSAVATSHNVIFARILYMFDKAL